MCNKKTKYTYGLDSNGIMTVWENDSVLCRISDVNKRYSDKLFAEVVYEMRGIDIESAKPIVKITGNLVLPADIGYRTFIRPKNGEMLFTSQVVDVRNETKNGMEIETRNTIYKLTFDKENELPLAG